MKNQGKKFDINYFRENHSVFKQSFFGGDLSVNLCVIDNFRPRGGVGHPVFSSMSWGYSAVYRTILVYFGL